MSAEPRPARSATAGNAPSDSADFAQQLRQLGARAHQLRATTRGADHFNAQEAAGERDTGSWLMSCTVDLAADLAADLDALARAVKERQADAALLQRLSPLRVRAHQLHAAAKAADHFLDQDTREDQDTGSWLVATAHALAAKLTAEMDDNVAPARRSGMEKVVEPHDPALVRRMAAATAPLRGAA
jgi:hypothetical protein